VEVENVCYLCYPVQIPSKEDSKYNIEELLNQDISLLKASGREYRSLDEIFVEEKEISSSQIDHQKEEEIIPSEEVITDLFISDKLDEDEEEEEDGWDIVF